MIAKKLQTAKNIPRTDSIQRLAKFWDAHDLTDFEDELVEVTKRVFDREAVLRIHLSPKDAKKVKTIAKSKGLDSPELIRRWVLGKVRTQGSGVQISKLPRTNRLP